MIARIMRAIEALVKNPMPAVRWNPFFGQVFRGNLRHLFEKGGYCEEARRCQQ
jgi:hypothetical protein